MYEILGSKNVNEGKIAGEVIGSERGAGLERMVEKVSLMCAYLSKNLCEVKAWTM